MIDEVVGLLGDEWPDYAQFVAEDPEDSLRIAEIALLRLVKIAEQLPQDEPHASPPRRTWPNTRRSRRSADWNGGKAARWRR